MTVAVWCSVRERERVYRRLKKDEQQHTTRRKSGSAHTNSAAPPGLTHPPPAAQPPPSPPPRRAARPPPPPLTRTPGHAKYTNRAITQAVTRHTHPTRQETPRPSQASPERTIQPRPTPSSPSPARTTWRTRATLPSPLSRPHSPSTLERTPRWTQGTRTARRR